MECDRKKYRQLRRPSEWTKLLPMFYGKDARAENGTLTLPPTYRACFVPEWTDVVSLINLFNADNWPIKNKFLLDVKKIVFSSFSSFLSYCLIVIVQGLSIIVSDNHEQRRWDFKRANSWGAIMPLSWEWSLLNFNKITVRI